MVFGQVDADPNNLAKAKQFIVQKQYAKAITLLETEASPKARYYQGWCYYKMGNCTAAVSQFNIFIANYSGDRPETWRAEALSNIQSCGGVSLNLESENGRTAEIKDIKEEVTINQTKPNSQQLRTEPDDGRPDMNNRDTEDDLVEKKDNTTSIRKELSWKSSDQSNHYKILVDVRREPDKEFFSLMQLGPVYTEQLATNRYAYYLGHYYDQEKALGIATKVKTSGFPLARVLEFYNGGLKDENVTEADVPIQRINKEKDLTYKVIFRSYYDPEWKFKALEHLGVVNLFDDVSSGPTIEYRYTIGNYTNIEQAKIMQVKLKEAGIKESKIAVFDKGEFLKIN